MDSPEWLFYQRRENRCTTNIEKFPTILTYWGVSVPHRASVATSQ